MIFLRSLSFCHPVIHFLGQVKRNIHQLTETIGKSGKKPQPPRRDTKQPDFFFKQILDFMPAHIAVLDTMGMIQYVNKAWIDFGEENNCTDENYGIGTSYIELCENAQPPHSEGAGETAIALKEMLAGQRDSFAIEYPCHSDHQQRWFSLKMSNFSYVQQRYIIVSHENITERRLALENLREARDDWESIFNSISDCALIIDKNNLIIEANKKAEQVLKKSREQIVGQYCYKVLHHSDCVIRNCPHQIMMRSRQSETREIFVEALNQVALVTVCPVYDDQGNFVKAIHITKDIAERKQTEQALKESENKFRTIFENMQDGYLLAGLDGNILLANPTAAAHLKYDKEELISKNMAADLYQNPAQRADLLGKLGQQGQVENYEIAFRRKDGQVLIAECNIHYVKDSQGQRIAIEGLFRDVTERKRVEKELYLKQFTINCAVDAVYMSVKDAHFVYVNDTACRMLGYTRDELLRMDVFDIDPNFPKENWEGHWQELQAKGQMIFESRHRTKQGRIFPVEVALNYLEFEGKGYNVAFCRDITAATEAREEKERILTLSRDLICIAGTDGRFKYLNPAAEKILGYPLEELYSQPFMNFIHPDDRNITEVETKKLAEGIPTVDFENRYLHKNGSIRTISWTVIPLPETGLLYCIGRDITERKQVELALRESEQRFRAMFEQAAVGVAQVESRSGKFIRINQRYCEIVGYSRQEMETMDFQTITHPDDVQRDLDNMKRLIDGQIHEFMMEKRYYRKDGTLVWVNLTVSPMWAPGQDPDYHIAVVEDITERKMAAKALQESRERLSSFLENSAVIAWMKDEAGRYVFLSDNYQKRFQVNFNDWKGKTDFEIWPKETAEEFHRNDLAVLKGGSPIEVVEQARNPDGSISWWLSNKFVFQDACGNRFVGGLGVDITQSTLAEQTLRESQRTLSTLISNLPGCSYRCKNDPDWTMEFLSSGIAALTGYLPEEMIDNRDISFGQLVHPDDYQWIWERIQQAIQNKEPFEYEYRIIDRRGELKWFWERGRGVFSQAGELLFLEGFIADVTERKKAEEAVRQRVQELTALYTLSEKVSSRLSLDQVVQFALEGIENYIHPDMVLILLRDNDQLHVLGQRWKGTEVQHEFASVLRVGECLCGLAVSENRAIYSRNINRDLRCTWSECKKAGLTSFAALPLHSVDGVMGVIGIASVTECDYREQATFLETVTSEIAIGLQNAVLFEQVKQHAAYLEEEIHNRNLIEQEREQLLKALTSINEELESIIYVSTHDLRSPLINIQGFGKELKEGCGQVHSMIEAIQNPSQIQQELHTMIDTTIVPAMDFITTSADKLDALQRGLLKLCYLGRTTLHLEQIHMDTLIQEIVDSAQQQVQQLGAQVVWSNLPDCFGDKDRFCQVFSGLLDNALKYVPHDQKPVVSITGREHEGMSLYCIEDNGLGIAPVYYDRIFEVFHRLEPNGPVTGVGIGLTIAKRVIERHNGKIWLESEPDRGTRFYVLLPCREEQIPSLFIERGI